ASAGRTASTRRTAVAGRAARAGYALGPGRALLAGRPTRSYSPTNRVSVNPRALPELVARRLSQRPLHRLDLQERKRLRRRVRPRVALLARVVAHHVRSIRGERVRGRLPIRGPRNCERGRRADVLVAVRGVGSRPG